jgi:hypothetical protein
MRKRKLGKRHVLELYRRYLNRLWHICLPFGLILLFLWWQISFSTIPIIETSRVHWLFAGAIVCLAITLFSLLTRNMAYVQASSSHIRLVTPFLRVNISYRRIRSVHPANFTNIYPPHLSGWAQRSSLSAYYGSTVIVIGLKSFPISPRVLRLFMPQQMFSPEEPGLVLLVPNWMTLSTELDTYIASWRHNKKRRESNIFALTS